MQAAVVNSTDLEATVLHSTSHVVLYASIGTCHTLFSSDFDFSRISLRGDKNPHGIFVIKQFEVSGSI
jgi:hypothetical protein